MVGQWEDRSMIVIQGKEVQLEVGWVREWEQTGLNMGKKKSSNGLDWIDQT